MPGAGHRVADAAEQRLDARGAEQRVVDVVEVGRASGRGSPCPTPPRRCRRKTMNSSSVPALALQPRSARRASWRRRIWRGEATTSLPSCQRDVGEAQRGALLPGHGPQRVEVGRHHEVAVAALPRGHRVAVDRVHLDVDGEQVVAAPRRRARRPRRGSGARAGACPAAGPACRSAQQHRVDRAGVDLARAAPRGSSREGICTHHCRRPEAN